LACSSIRHAPLFGLAAALGVAGVFPHTLWAAKIARQGGDLFVPPDKLNVKRAEASMLAIPGLFLIACLLLRSDVIPSPLGKSSWAKLDEEIWPLSVVEHLQAEPSGAKLF